MPRPVDVSYLVYPTNTAVAAAAAELFRSAAAAAVAARGVARIAISGGSTPKAMFALLADQSKPYFAATPWDSLELFWVDERCVPPTHADSNYRMTNEAMLSTIRNVFKLEGAQTPTFDLILLGMGDDGHTASLFPHTEALNEMGLIVTANHVPQKDTWRITLTWPVINQARKVAFLIEGAGKAEVLKDVLLGPYDPETKPSQLIRPSSGQLTFLLDRASAAKLPEPAAVAGSETATGTLELR